MHLIRHLVADDKLTARRMAGDNDALQIGKHVFARQTPDDFVYKVERRKFVIANLTASGAPAISTLRFADPVGLVRSQDSRDYRRSDSRAHRYSRQSVAKQ